MIRLENLSFSYESTDAPILRRINVEIETGEILLVSGATGSGKSTLLKTFNGLAPHFTGGTISGKIIIEGIDVVGARPHDVAALIGYVNQQPEGAFATDTVEEELVFGLEQLGWLPSDMHARVQDLAVIFDLEALLNRPLAELSGGQQQRVAIASALAAGQKVLILDEPTSALDDQAAAKLLRLIADLAHVHSVTILIAEHRFERVLPIVDSVLVVHGDGSVEKVSAAHEKLKTDWQKTRGARQNNPGPSIFKADQLAKVFGKTQALAPMSLTLQSSSITAVTGDNGSGKTTLLWEVYRAAKHQGINTAMVPQNAADLLFLSTLAEELAESDLMSPNSKSRTSTRLESFVGRINPATHPRDLSAGQQLALVLAIQLATDAPLIILDEPTRGLDLKAKMSLVDMLLGLRDQGHCVLVASHDADFIGAVATRQIALDHGRASEVSDEG
jgi:energy-coupling factor transport system ATP-binding protein